MTESDKVQPSYTNQLGKRPRNQLTVTSFSEKSFIEEVKRASCVNDDAWAPNTQTLYLGKYLHSLGAKTLVIERHYIDRHFMEEVSLYYSKNLLPRQNWTTRIHIFSEPIDHFSIEKSIQDAIAGHQKDVSQQLQKAYRGYIVIRPLPSVPIGRTVLNHLGDKLTPKFPTCYQYPVHFLGFELHVKGIAFQQQDRAVAACATTAIWTALQRVMRREGARPPTSWEITEAAVQHYLPHGRPYPSSGLTSEQMCEALRYFGFAPDVLRVFKSPDEFRLLMSIYLQSGIPVILSFGDKYEQHAVTVVGYSESEPKNFKISKNSDDSYSLAIHGLAFDQIFIHDDRLGPYALAKFEIDKRTDNQGEQYDQLIISIVWPDGKTETADVQMAAIPLYPKLRSSAKELFETATEHIPIIQKAFIDQQKPLGLYLYFERSGEYQSSLYDKNVDPKRIVEFQQSIALSRYIGVHRWYLGNKPVMETIWDTTDTMRETKFHECLLGVVCLDETHRDFVDGFAKLFDAIPG